MKEQFIDNTVLRILFFLYPHDLYNFKICLIKHSQTNKITNTEIKQNKRTKNLRNEFKMNIKDKLGIIKVITKPLEEKPYSLENINLTEC
jgi:hypothetical protein